MAYIHQTTGLAKSRMGRRFSSHLFGCPVRRKQGRLLGKMEALGFDLRTEASLTVLTSDVVKSSAIEGEVLNTDEVPLVDCPQRSLGSTWPAFPKRVATSKASSR